MTELFKPFVAPKLKLRRAAQHLQEYEGRFSEFAASVPYQLFLVPQRDGTAQCYFGMMAFIPPEIPMAYGDAIHGLRTALDLVAIDAVALNGRSTCGVRFPFAENPEGLSEQIKRAKFDRASEEAVRLLREQMPWRKGNELLRALHELDLQDKHQMILPIYPRVAFSSLRFQYNGSYGTGGIFNCDFGIEDRIGLMEGMPEAVDIGPTTLYAVFNDECPAFVRTKRLSETFHSFSKAVSGVIEAFELLLTGSITEVPPLAPVAPPSLFGRRPFALVSIGGGGGIPLSRWNDGYR